MDDTPIMRTFSHKHYASFRSAARRAMAAKRFRFRFRIGEVPVNEATDMLNNFPRSGSTFELWHITAMKNIEVDALKWLREMKSDPNAELDGESLLEFYLEKLKQHFEPQFCRASLQEFEHLQQGDLSPMMHLTRVQAMVPYVEHKYGRLFIAYQYLDSLNPEIRDRVDLKYCNVRREDLFNRLEEIAQFAECVWGKICEQPGTTQRREGS
ncbi:hypothetical protein Vafri_11203 [Volvox africanus]|nr:hypothetical protein Vafri_11203 [Volvox africanus]